MMAHRTATLSISPPALDEALRLTLAVTPGTPGEQTAQREITTSLESALEARRQRILVSRSQVNLIKWVCLILQAMCAIAAIAIVHSDNRLASAITMGVFATGVAASVLLILSHDRPFTGEISVGPEPLLQVRPETDINKQGMDTAPQSPADRRRLHWRTWGDFNLRELRTWTMTLTVKPPLISAGAYRAA